MASNQLCHHDQLWKSKIVACSMVQLLGKTLLCPYTNLPLTVSSNLYLGAFESPHPNQLISNTQHRSNAIKFFCHFTSRDVVETLFLHPPPLPGKIVVNTVSLFGTGFPCYLCEDYPIFFFTTAVFFILKYMKLLSGWF